MNAEELSELVTAVHEINEELYDIAGEDRDDYFIAYFSVNLKTDGSNAIVTFISKQIWSSEDDYRTFNEATNEYEPFVVYLRRKVESTLKEFSDVYSKLTQQ